MTERVCAVVLTYNRKDMLRMCLQSLLRQERPADKILVIDNGCTDDTPAMLASEFPEIAVLRLDPNVGASGGFHAGIEAAHREGFDWLWVSDDDAHAAPDCLRKLLQYSGEQRVLTPVQTDAIGGRYAVSLWNGMGIDITPQVLSGELPPVGRYLFAWVGVLLPRGVIDRVGLPEPGFFVWFDDWEYAMRVHQHCGDIRVVPDALIHHDLARKPTRTRLLWRVSWRTTFPPWRTYYGTRNALYVMLRQKRPAREFRLWARTVLRAYVSDMVYGPERWKRFAFRTKGIWDALHGRLGKRIPGA
ncbi:MAG TPA: glycosyltransferase family 2 protein [Thermoanaerobaculia bacterium]|nr:glycosyltransferase family 2 protein [Thermoanaerobaculia bacterium]